MSTEYLVAWLKAAGIRALRTAAQTALATIGTTALLSEINWAVVGSASAVAAVISILMSLAGLPEVRNEILDKIEEEYENDRS